MGGRSEDSRASEEPQFAGPRIFDLDVFSQDHYWVDDGGGVYVLAELSREHARQLAEWLHWNARHFYLQALRNQLALALRQVDHGPTEDDAWSVPSMLFLSAEQWMAQTPLMLALAEAQ